MKPTLHQTQRGVSMIEMVIVMAIFAILFGLAAPSFQAWTTNVQIRTTTESIQNGLQLARAEAIRRNTSVMFWLTSGTNPLTGDWLVGCANPVGNGAQPEAAFDCPGTQTNGVLAAAGPPYNWIQRASAVGEQAGTVQVATTPNTIVVTFNSLGMVMAANPGDNNSAPIQKIDVTQPALAGSRALEVQISGGQIRMCDPALALATDPRGCQ
jgi:type IV fimbrial biogenesis protein FimT